MRLGLTVLVLAGALAGLFVTASRPPGAVQTIAISISLVKLTGTGCKPTPIFNVVCRSHARAERLGARFGSQDVPVTVHGKAVLLP